MTIVSTSFNRLSGDRGMRRPQQQLYFLLNRLNNLFPLTNLDMGMDIRDFRCGEIEARLLQFPITTSPSRLLSDLFWMQLPWARIKQELGEIRILDTGCGSGDYGCKLVEWSGGAVCSYTGLDPFASENWATLEAEYPAFRFHKCRETDISQHFQAGANLLMTQSAIEHFDEDLGFFNQIAEYVHSCRKPVLQVHLFPISRLPQAVQSAWNQAVQPPDRVEDNQAVC